MAVKNKNSYNILAVTEFCNLFLETADYQQLTWGVHSANHFNIRGWTKSL